MEVSGKASINIEEAFFTLARDIKAKMEDNHPQAGRGSQVKSRSIAPKQQISEAQQLGGNLDRATFVSKNHDNVFKLLVIGDTLVGKTRVTHRLCYADDDWSEMATVGVDLNNRTIELDGKKIKLQIWDASGLQRFRNMITSYFKGSMGILLVYDITNERSFSNIKEHWMQDVEQFADEDVEIMILGNKCDINNKRVVSRERGEQLATEYGIKFMEVSGKTGINIEEAFYSLARDIKVKMKEKLEAQNHPQSGGGYQAKSKPITLKIRMSKIHQLGKSLDTFVSNYDDGNMRINFENLLQELEFISFEKALSTLASIELDLLLMVLYQIIPDTKLKDEVDEISNLPQTNFRSLQDVLTYANAVKTSGIVEEAKGMVVVVGNSGAGKSSFVRTLEDFCQHQIPKPFLTGDKENAGFIETKVLEVVENVVLESSLIQDVEINHPKNSKVNLVSFIKIPEPKKADQKFTITFYDFGGHKEYFICSSLFMKERGVFVVCFDSSKISMDKYFPLVGTYLELISECCNDPTYILMATKVDNPAAEENDRVFSQILGTATEHVCSIAARSSEDRRITLVNQVFKTSSKEVTAEMLHEFSSNLFTLFQSEELMDIKSRSFPLSWKSLITDMKSKGRVSVKFVQEEYEKKYVVQENIKNLNVKKKTIEFITNMQNAISKFNTKQEKESHSITEEDNHELIEVVETKEDTKITRPKSKLKDPIQKLKDPDSFIKKNTGKSKGNLHNEVKRSKRTGGKYLGSVLRSILGKFFASPITREVELIEIKRSAEVELILSVFSSLGEILWFKLINELNDVIIPQPMKLVKSIRQIIRHDIKSPFQDSGKLKDFHEMIEKGFVSKGCFDQLYAATKEDQFPNEETWLFLINLGLASSIEDPPSLYIPSLIDDENEVFIRKEMKVFEQDDKVLGFHYHFKRTKKVMGLYADIISKLASKRDVYKGKKQVISFKKAFSQKIENRLLGVVAGLRGSLKWTLKNKTTPAEYDFLILEYDTDYLADQNFQFARDKGIRVYIRPRDTLSAETFGVISLFDQLIKELTKGNYAGSNESFERFIICDKCSIEGKEGYFTEVGVNFRSTDDFQECNNGHQLNQKHKTIDPPKPFSWDSFLQNGIENIPRKKFREVFQMIKDGEVDDGEQIWIYRDGSTTCCNPITFFMTYAHVVVYIGQDEVTGVYEGVHVTKNTGCCPGFLMSTIDRVDITSIIKPNDEVFLGHEIPEITHSTNIRRQIKDRAIACADSPKLVFDYNEKNNCEGFANLLLTPSCACSGNAQIGAQKADSCCISSLCCCIKLFKCCRREKKQLKFVVRQRLEERGLMPKD